MKASAEVLGNGGTGSSYKARMANGVMVVVKRTREMNTLSKDEFDAEIRKLGRLHHANILTPLAFHYQPDEKLLVYEYMPKAVCFICDRGPSHAELNWSVRLKIVQGIAEGLGYLHTKLASSHLPHGNLKSSNVFLSDDSEPLLSEFGLRPLISPPNVGSSIVWYLNNAKGGTDVVQWVESAISDGRETELLDPEIASSTNSLGQMRRLLGIGAACVERNPEQRLNITDAIQMIQDITLERTIQALPSLRDGYADAPQTRVSDIQEADGEIELLEKTWIR
ncbi:hypothetical protein DKX38_001233 [Salix brachista]|uniref:Protein kinase domain-containing protein n=1 Tax=Salix brachista TaxID=2182728 RepID=A0A5N5P3I2_9ROSI|nr:hypothetical protein DKX38_001233 [Salix brachista]